RDDEDIPRTPRRDRQGSRADRVHARAELLSARRPARGREGCLHPRAYADEASARPLQRRRRCSMSNSTSLHKLLSRTANAIGEVGKAFGAPGDFGYGTPEGRALSELYNLRPVLNAS